MNVDRFAILRNYKFMKKYTKDNVHKITRTGKGSHYVVIPKEMMKELNWKDKQKVKIKVSRKRIIISDWKR
ncbi:MAG TPA: AbrB/MazE/SpoVT family DNA-binding domain-containing protein [Patescibacteria group bacterium]